METTRHFTATTYVVNDGETVLHEHPRLNLWLPPGGHIQRDELPHEAAVREAHEETGLSVDLAQSANGPTSATARPLPQPAAIMLEDINVHGDNVGHQHIDFIYYSRSTTRQIGPSESDESPADDWSWFSTTDLQDDDRFAPDVREHASRAIQTVESPDDSSTARI